MALPTKYDPALLEQLTPRERAFIEHPEILSNAEKAARDVGYSESWAKARSHQKRKALMYYILPRVAKRLNERGVDLDRVQEELTAIAFAVESDYYLAQDVEGSDQTIMVAKDPVELTDEQRRAIQSMRDDVTILSDGTRVYTRSYVLHDKKVALKMLAEMLGGFDPKNRTPGDAESRKQQAALFDFMTSEEFDTLVKIYNRASERQKKQAVDVPVIEGKSEEVKP